MNNIILLIIGALSLSILIYKIVKNLKSDNTGCSSGCNNCPISNKKKR